MPNLFCKIFILAGLTALSSKAYSQNQENPGIIESLERLLEVHNKQFDQTKTNSQSNLKAISEINDLGEIKIDPQFMRSLIFNSDNNFLRLSQKNECKFYSTLENNLLKTKEGDVENIIFNFKNKDNKIETAIIPKNDFFEQIYKKKCLNNKEFSALFSEVNFQKTIEGIKFLVPKNKLECENIYKEWLENAYTPYLCNIQQIIKKSKNFKKVDLYKEKIVSFKRTYLDNLCSNLNSPLRFCENYLKDDIWNKVINGEAPSFKLSFKCQNLLTKNEIDSNELKTCASKLIAEPTICETKGTKNSPAFFPLTNCNSISDALNNSKLKTNYHDCPGNVDNEAMTNIHRIVSHFAQKSNPIKNEACEGETNYTFARLNFSIKHDEGWPLKICFYNNIKSKEECLPYIPGSKEGEPLSENQIVAKILYQQKGAPAKTKCRIVDSKTYNPLRSDFKFGCFIVNDAENCTTLSCDKKIIWEDKLVSGIRFTGKPIFDYFPSAFLNERYSFLNMINEVNGTQGRAINNLTDLKFYLNTMPNSIIHGIGCVEDLLPEDFQRTVINQCHPMPFIIDGHLVKNNETWLVLRAAIDDLHSPRLTLWHNVFNSVSAYRELHPLNTWTLYGIKK